MCSGMWKPEGNLGVIPQVLYTLFLKTGSFTERKLTNYSKLGGQVPKDWLAPQNWGTNMVRHVQPFLYGFWGFRSSCSCSEHDLPRPYHWFLPHTCGIQHSMGSEEHRKDQYRCVDSELKLVNQSLGIAECIRKEMNRIMPCGRK